MNELSSQNVDVYEKLFKGGYDHVCPNENMVRLVQGFFGKGGEVLDFGFGPGENLLYLLKAGYTCTGVDTSESARKITEGKLDKHPEFKGKSRLYVLEENQKDLPFPDNQFDYILSNQVVFFLADEEKMLNLFREFKRVLKPKGRLIISMMSRLNSHCVNGKQVAPNIYAEEHEDIGSTDYVYIVQDEAHVRRLFSMFEIHEVGWFENHYFGRSGHYYVVLAANNK